MVGPDCQRSVTGFGLLVSSCLHPSSKNKLLNTKPRLPVTLNAMQHSRRRSGHTTRFGRFMAWGP